MEVILAHKGELFLFPTSPDKQPFQMGPFPPGTGVCVQESSPWRGGGQPGGERAGLRRSHFPLVLPRWGAGITQPLFGEELSGWETLGKQNKQGPLSAWLLKRYA